MKKTLTQKQIAEYEQFCYDRDHGRLLTPDGLRLVCAAHEYNAEAIGKHFLELLPRLGPTGEATPNISIDLDSSPVIEMTEDEKIEFVAARILKKYKPAFIELAKCSTTE